jgi:hypothetical protein
MSCLANEHLFRINRQKSTNASLLQVIRRDAKSSGQLTTRTGRGRRAGSTRGLDSHPGNPLHRESPELASVMLLDWIALDLLPDPIHLIILLILGNYNCGKYTCDVVCSGHA